jgi:hypothetical protein
MAALYGDNYTLQYVNKPSEKVLKGDIAGRVRTLTDSKTLDAVIAANDTIDIGFLPADSRVVGAEIFVNKSLGATGIFQLGHTANGVDSADPDAFVASADAGGQAVHAKMALEAGCFKKYTVETKLQVKCTEVTDGTVLDGVITVVVFYVND